MTSVTQKIRRFTGGISDQPDEQKLPGQVRDATNATPDVVYGLLKRPGTNLIPWNDDVTDEGKWFWINKRNPATGEERYVGQISLTSGKVRIWNLFDGKEQTVEYKDNVTVTRDFAGAVGVAPANSTTNEPYFTQGHDPNDLNVDDLQVLTVNDVTYITNRKVTVSMSANCGEKREPEGYYELRTLAGETTYSIRLYDVTNGDPVVTSIAISATKGDLGTLTYTNDKAEKSFDDNGLTGKIVIQRYTDPKGISFYSESLCLINPGTAARAVGDKFDVTEGSVTWSIEIESISDTASRGDDPIIPDVEFTTPASGVTSDAILTGLKDKIDGFPAAADPDNPTQEELDAQFSCEVIGNGIYFTRKDPFSVETTNGSLSRLLGPTSYDILQGYDSNNEPIFETHYVATAANITELPTQCKAGLVALVGNSIDSALDNTYRVFEGDNFVDGPGVWVETTRPGQPNEFNPSTMPHLIVRSPSVDPTAPEIRTFWVGSGKWVPREVGDEETAERPSFAPIAGQNFGQPINNILFYKSRLVFLTGESVVLSRPDKPFDFWFKTAETSSPSDRIDLDVSNDFPSVLFAAVENNTGLILFSENNQYLLSNGDTGALTPSTAQIGRLSTYNFNRDSNPVSLGTTTGFVGNQGKFTRFYEMAAIRREGEPDVIEQSKVVERKLPQAMNLVGISKENDMIALGKKGEKEIWLFRYFDNGEQRQQSSWFKWEFDGELVSHVIFFDSYYLVLKKNNKVYLVRCDLRLIGQPTSTFTFDTEDYKNIQGDVYRGVYLDYIQAGTGTYSNKYTTFDLPNFPIFPGEKILAVSTDVNKALGRDGQALQGRLAEAEIIDGSIKLRGDWTQAPVAFGYNYKMEIVLPQFYITKSVNQNTTESLDTANLIVHRVKMNLGQIGYYETTLKRLGRNDYTQVYEAKPMDLYQADELGWMPDYEQTTPIYQRNTTFNLIIKSEHPSPAALYSATLEGVYTENYYKRA